MKPHKSRSVCRRKKIFYILIVLAIVLFVVSYSLSINGPQEEASQYSFNGGTLTISPSVFYVHSFLWYSPSVSVSVTLNNNISVVQAYVYQGYSTNHTIFNQTFRNVSYVSFYFVLHPAGTSQVEKFLLTINGQLIPVSVAVKSSPYPLIGELSLFFSFGLLLAGLYYAPFKSKLWIIPITVSYLILSTFLGHRYDMFFMISGGFHLLSGVNPFLKSPNLPGTIKWAYPPYYLVWSVISDWFAGAFTHTVIPSPQSLVFPGVKIGNYYEAWRGFLPNSLPVYYLLSKLPMVISVLGIYYLLLKKFKLPYNLTKLWLLSPYVILIGVIWGQLDIIASLFLVLSVYYMQKGRSDLAVLASVVGFWVKIFPIFILPLILIESKNRLKDLGIMLVSSVPAVLIYLLSGNFVEELEVMIYSRSVPTFNGVFYAQGLSWQVILTSLGVTHFPPLFLYSFIPFLVVISVIYYYKRGNIVNYVIMELLFFFLTYNFVDPQYLIVLVPLFLINKDLWNYTVFSLYPLLFTLLTYSFAYFVVPSLSLNYFASPLGQQEALRTWVTSSNIFIFTLLIAFTLSVAVTMFMIVTNRQFGFLKNSFFFK